MQVVLRNPWESLTRPGMGGGTLVDATARDWRDRVLEAFPLVEEGFFEVEDLSLGTDEDGAWVTFFGNGKAFPPLGEGTLEPVEVTWRLAVDSHVLSLEGADGLWLRPGEGVRFLAAGFVLDGFAVVTDGAQVANQGGALWLEDVHRVIAAPIDEAFALLWPSGEVARGECSGDAVEVWDAEILVAVLEPSFDTLVPAGASLVCVATGAAPGEARVPGTDLLMDPGEPGGLLVRVADDQGKELPVFVRWDEGQAALPVGGEVVPIPPGTWNLVAEAGPAHDRWTGTVEIPGDPLRLELRRAIDTSNRVLLELGREAWPSWRSGLSAEEDLESAAAAGRDLVIQAPPDEIADPDTVSWAARQVRGLGGSLAETEDAGRVWSWPWSPNEKRAGHGAVAWQGLSPEDVLALARGADGERFTVVDAAWVQSAGEPWTWNPAPDLFRLASLDDLPVLLEVLSHGIPVGVVGPLAWGAAETLSLPSAAALQRDLVTGAACATSGPLLELSSESLGFNEAGDILSLSLSLQARASAGISLLELYVDGQVVATEVVDPGETSSGLDWTGIVSRSVLGVASGEEWAVSAPILRTP